MCEFLQQTVGNNMTRSVRSIGPETTVADLYRLFAAEDFDSHPVVRGIIAREDVMRAMERSTLRQYPPVVPFETV